MRAHASGLPAKLYGRVVPLSTSKRLSISARDTSCSPSLQYGDRGEKFVSFPSVSFGILWTKPVKKKILYLRFFFLLFLKEMLVENCSLVNWMSCLCLGCFGWRSHAPLSLRMKIFFHLRASISLTLFTVYELCICRQISSDRGLTCFFSLFFLRTLCGYKFRFSITSRFKD